jgi:ABC-type nitrate/sulfonate/bicarbonate transport system ATPase subunit
MEPLSLEVLGVRHRHPDATRDTPADSSFALRSGERALVVGPNGSGKTTLLMRLGAGSSICPVRAQLRWTRPARGIGEAGATPRQAAPERLLLLISLAA